VLAGVRRSGGRKGEITFVLLLIAPVKTAFHLRFGRMNWTFELYREFPLNWLLLN
jgi:hypothetical protein